MPGIVPGTEWAAYYDDLVAEFGLTIEATGPNFGSDALLDTVADTPALATFMGEHTRLVWPAGHGLRRIPVTDPTPVYPHSLLWHRHNPPPRPDHPPHPPHDDNTGPGYGGNLDAALGDTVAEPAGVKRGARRKARGLPGPSTEDRPEVEKIPACSSTTPPA